MEIYEVWEYLVDAGICTDDEIKLVTYINGTAEETLNDIIYVRTGCRNFEQLLQELD